MGQIALFLAGVAIVDDERPAFEDLAISALANRLRENVQAHWSPFEMRGCETGSTARQLRQIRPGYDAISHPSL